MPPLQRNREIESSVGAGYIPPSAVSVLAELDRFGCHSDRTSEASEWRNLWVVSEAHRLISHRSLGSLRSVGMTS